jgi:hypothetical protein
MTALRTLSMFPTMFGPWELTDKFDPRAAMLADRHYSRRKPGSPQFMPPGQTIVLVTRNGSAVFGWWRPDPGAGIVPMDGLDGWTCTIFRNESTDRSSDMILEAERALVRQSGGACGPDGMLTYVWDAKVKSINPGYCFKRAGWTVHKTKPRSVARVRDEVLPAYLAIGPAGAFGAAMIRADLDEAARALAEGDVVAMIRVYQALRETRA